MGRLAVLQSSVECRAPRKRPLTHVAILAAGIERFLGRCRELGRFGGADLTARIHGEQMRRVAMMIVRVVAVGHPLLKLSPLANFRPDQLFSHRGDLVAIWTVNVQSVGCGDVVGEQVVDDLLAVADAVLARAMLGRPAIGHRQPSVGQCLQAVGPEFAYLLDDRIGDIFQINLIAAKLIVPPEMLTVPSIGGVVPLPAHAAGDVVRRADRPAARRARGRLEFRRGLGGLAPGFKLASNQLQERLVAFSQVGWFGRPVVHLDVDIRMIVAMPGRIVAVVPKSLQIGRKSAGARA